MKIQSQQILHTVSAHNSRIIFSKMTFWGALNSNLVQICAFYLRKLPKNWTFDQKMRILLQFQQGAQSIQAEYCTILHFLALCTHVAPDYCTAASKLCIAYLFIERYICATNLLFFALYGTSTYHSRNLF